MLALLSAALLVAMVLAWRYGPRQTYTPDPDDPLDDGSSAPIDHEELERAERELRGLSATVQPDDESLDDDWGPGSPKGPR